MGQWIIAHGPNSTCYLFSQGLETKNDIWLFKSKLINNVLWNQESMWIPNSSVHRVACKHRHIHLFVHRQWLLTCYDGSLNHLPQEAWSPESWKYFLSFYRALWPPEVQAEGRFLWEGLWRCVWDLPTRHVSELHCRMRENHSSDVVPKTGRKGK